MPGGLLRQFRRIDDIAIERRSAPLREATPQPKRADWTSGQGRCQIAPIGVSGAHVVRRATPSPDQLHCPVCPHAVQNSQPSRLIIAAAPQLGHTLPFTGAVSCWMIFTASGSARMPAD